MSNTFDDLTDYVMRVTRDTLSTKKYTEGEAKTLISRKIQKEFESLLTIQETLEEMKDI